MKYFFLLTGFLAALPHMAQATVADSNLQNRNIAIFFSNDIHGETEPCG